MMIKTLIVFDYEVMEERGHYTDFRVTFFKEVDLPFVVRAGDELVLFSTREGNGDFYDGQRFTVVDMCFDISTMVSEVRVKCKATLSAGETEEGIENKFFAMGWRKA
ncbi:MAG: hypothetical protein RBS36_04220 [Thiomicrospira sp.]|jgi:hypothetical protein|nr:hypothetical protein [Thiomicrospira sp.]